MKVYPVEQPEEPHSLATEQVVQLAAQAVQAPEEAKNPEAQVVQASLAVQELQLDPQAEQPPVEFLKYPVAQPEEVQVSPAEQVLQLFGQTSQTLVSALLT